MQIIDRSTSEIKESNPSKTQKFLYNNVFGRMLLKVLTLRFISVLGGKFLNSKRSTKRIKKFVEANNIDLSQYEEKKYVSYNDFFTRKIKEGSRKVNMDESALISPCDSKLSVHQINDNNVYAIKNSYYRLEDLVDNRKVVKDYQDGFIFIFRLTVDDYHRYCYIDNLKKSRNRHIKGVFHTVNPLAFEYYDVFHRNSREYSILETENFGTAVQIEVGALMVGKIKNHHQEGTFKKGEEKGYFEFGGSTIVLLIKKDMVKVDDDLLENTANGLETIVKYGEKIGEKISE